jgi:small-conductance mechanosensitive channel
MSRRWCLLLWLGIGFLAALVTPGLEPAPATAQVKKPTAPEVAPVPRAAPPTPVVIAVSEVTARAEEVNAYLRALDSQLTPGAQIVRIQRELPQRGRRLVARFDRTRRVVETQAEFRTLDSLLEFWESARADLLGWMHLLTTRAVWLDQQRDRLGALQETWTRTKAAAELANAPVYVLQRVNTVLGSLMAAQGRVEAERADALSGQEDVARELTRCEDALGLLGEARRRAASELLLRESPPIWKMRPQPPSREALRSSLEAQVTLLRQFAEDQLGGIELQTALVCGLIALFWWVRRQASEWKGTKEIATPLVVVFERPVAAGLVLGLLSSLWIYSGQPAPARTLLEIGALLPVVLVVRGLLPGPLLSGLYALAAFFLVDRLRDLLLVFPVTERVLFLLEVLAAALVLAWFLRSGRLNRLDAAGATLGRGLRVAMWLALAGFAAAFAAGAVGNMSLARLLGSGILASGSLALVLAAARRLGEGLVSFALRVWPCTRLRMVDHHRPLLERRLHRLVYWLAVLTWVGGALDYFGLFTPAVDRGRQTLAAELTLGALHLSVGDVLAFVVTVWASFQLSSLVRFVLEEDVFPRLRLRAGLPYALSSFVRYAIVFVGFVLALLALGVNLDRVTILGGAFGVGVGFGLQNIVNNFVSGLIVLFERPVRVGDAVQIGEVQGEVRRIGIRSSTVYTGEGAEVIVPNSLLVSEKVTNWTPVDQRRRLDVPVNVAYGTAPADVLKVLDGVARAHQDVVGQPAPQALFLGFGDSALRFELRAWTDRLDRHVTIRSALGVAVYAALREAGMTIPFPQQDVHVRQEPPVGR